MSPKRTKTKAEQEEAADAAAKYNKDDKGKQKQDAKAQQAGPPAAATKAPRPLSGEWTGLRVVPDDDAPLPDASSGSRKRKTRQEEGAAAGSDSAPQGHCLPPPFFRPQEHATLTRALLKAHLPDLFLTGPALGGSAEKKEAEVKELTAEYLRFMTLKWEEAQRPAAERQVLGPSKLVDAAWHAHITDTKSYAAFCDRSFGGMVHHDPNCGPEYYKYTLERLDSVMGVKPTADLLRFWPGFDIAYGKKYGSVAAAAAAAAAITAAAAGGGERIASSGSSDDPGAAAADGQQQQPPPPTPDAVVAALASALAASPQPLLAPGTPLFTALMSSPQAARAYWYATGFAMGFVEDMVKAGDLSDDYISDEFGQDCG